MTQHQLDRSVARATGESVDFIRRFGFSEMPMPEIILAPLEDSQSVLPLCNAQRYPSRDRKPIRKAA